MDTKLAVPACPQPMAPLGFSWTLHTWETYSCSLIIWCEKRGSLYVLSTFPSHRASLGILQPLLGKCWVSVVKDQAGCTFLSPTNDCITLYA